MHTTKDFPLQVGDHIEKIDGKPLVGHRHYEVAKMLKEIPRGTTFVMRLVEPLKAGFGECGKEGTEVEEGTEEAEKV